MPEILKERCELDPQFQWALPPPFESDAAWETALDSLDADIESLAAFAGKLTDAVTIGAYLDASTEVGRKVERLYCYASQRHDEDTRDDKAQSMYARIGSKYVKMAAALSFAQPEILSLPEETLTAIVNDPAVADYKFNLEDLLRGKPHTLMMRTGLRMLHCHSAEAVMVGDRMDTDVISGMECGLSTVLVLSGISTEAPHAAYAYRPSAVLDGVGDIVTLAEAQHAE